MPDASRRIVGTGADIDLLPADEARDLACDVDAARIIVHTDRIIVGMAVIMVRTGRIQVGTPVTIVRTDRINVGAIVIIVGTNGCVVGTRGNGGSAR